MSWRDPFPLTVDLADSLAAAGPGAQLDAHLNAVADRSAAAPVAPSAASETAQMYWLGALLHGELLAFLGMRPRASTITVICLEAAPGLALLDAEGQPLALFTDVATLADAELLALASERPVVLAGPADRLWALAQLLESRAVSLQTLAVIVENAPVLPGAARLLHERFAAPVGEGLRAPDGGWLAITRTHGELLEPVRPREQLYATGQSGDQLAMGQWGLLGSMRDEAQLVMSVWARLRASRDGVVGIELGVPATPLGSSVRPELDTTDLHDMLGTLPVFAYCVRFEPNDAHHLDISIVPGCDLDQAKAQILASIAIGIEQLAVVFTAPGVEFMGMRVYDARGIGRDRAVVVWGGAPGSEARRAAWREVISAAGGGGRRVRLLDADTGEAREGVAGEVAAQLRREREQTPDIFGTGDTEWSVYVGDATGETAHHGHGWISLLEGDDAREPMLIAGVDRGYVRALQQLFESGTVDDRLAEITLEGIDLQAYSRPMLGRGRAAADDRRPLWVDETRCVGAGDCVRICPTHAITMAGEPARPVIDPGACIRCQLCSERCESSALRPLVSDDAAIRGHELVREAELLRGVRTRARPRVLAGKLTEPPPALDRRRAPAVVEKAGDRKPSVVLGLATVTLMEHAAALLIDGELVSAIEEERLARVRHYTWQHPERPGTSLSSDIALRLEDAWPPRAIDAVLRTAGLTMDDVDLVAINGIPARFRQSFAGGGGWRPPPVLRANSVVFVPHHMSHAACVYGLSDYDDAWVLSIDGRGDYETATIWRAQGHDLQVVDAVPWQPDCSFGGVYETVTRVLGFGSHGQGSTMALAALGQPRIDLSSCMSMGDDGKPVLSEWAAEKLFDRFARGRDEPITDDHRDLAASIQQALETTVGDYLAHHIGPSLQGTTQNLAVCGGVALNCKMNGVLRDRFQPADMYVPPGANDAGTAIGAAIIGHRELTGELPRLGLGHTHLGPSWSDEAIAAALGRMRVPFTRMRDVGGETAELIAAGKIVCWFQGPMEFGPRALGGRSINADPRRDDLKPRLNAMKSREPWRPFGPSVLAGRQSEWFIQDWDSRFMLFAVDVRPEKREQIPVVVHYDGSSRPQVVHAEHHPRYHAMISAFEQRTGVPMVVNTSFNRGGEAIACNPVEAMRSFVGLGADAIVLGDSLVLREQMRRR
ncbi:carbamoyltransferase C-terminal domain-containing protein [Enhygromyxa salina]|uniref:Decarbamoylnovobiocin carbamoyltransferase n=1 Tax=Enhygromyxa salina TaxID=215803 RepID=A0A2S9YDV9_9BACT|nr:carbamoyltransferase C-terminal domain-containing protein [Enhygromyxa salina]PRQ03222.1 Decarbamoylnovobiocin carbamoyltransferase [Enhygromyxa salina]